MSSCSILTIGYIRTFSFQNLQIETMVGSERELKKSCTLGNVSAFKSDKRTLIDELQTDKTTFKFSVIIIIFYPPRTESWSRKIAHLLLLSLWRQRACRPTNRPMEGQAAMAKCGSLFLSLSLGSTGATPKYVKDRAHLSNWEVGGVFVSRLCL